MKKDHKAEEEAIKAQEESQEQVEKKEDKKADKKEKKKKLTAEEKLQEEVEEANNKFKEVNDKYLRLYSEFDNYKKRTTKERLELLKNAGEDIIVSMLPVLDDFDRALNAMEKNEEMTAAIEGVTLISSKFKSILSQKGLKEMESPIGQELNTDFHDAITNIPAPSEELKGKIVDVVEKGYLINEKVIRYAKVVVGQ